MTKQKVGPGEGIRLLPPFPVVLITVKRNIMTAGAFHFYSFDPPSVMVGIIPSRYTYELLEEANEFGVNIPRADQIEMARICGSVSGREEDKYESAGLTPVKGGQIDGFLIEECPLNLECGVVHRVDFPGTHRWFVGEIQAVHVESGYVRDQALMFWSGEYRGVGRFLESAW